MSTGPEQPVATPEQAAPATLEMPAPTACPIVLAMGITLMLAGVVTNPAVSVVGLIVAVAAGVGWSRIMLSPSGGHELERVEVHVLSVRPAPGTVATLEPGMPGQRMSIPEQIHPYSAGAKGGLIGAVSMAVPALLYGLLSEHHSLWYPINLLAGMVATRFAGMSEEDLEAFQPLGLVVGTVIHVVSSVGVGLLYGVVLPMLPQRPAILWGGYFAPLLWGGIIAPLLWTGGIYGFMGVLNPAMREHVNWFWFVVSQFAYGVTVGLVVTRSENVYVGR
jgi:hypothetical protein